MSSHNLWLVDQESRTLEDHKDENHEKATSMGDSEEPFTASKARQWNVDQSGVAPNLCKPNFECRGLESATDNQECLASLNCTKSNQNG